MDQKLLTTALIVVGLGVLAYFAGKGESQLLLDGKPVPSGGGDKPPPKPPPKPSNKPKDLVLLPPDKRGPWRRLQGRIVIVESRIMYAAVVSTSSWATWQDVRDELNKHAIWDGFHVYEDVAALPKGHPFETFAVKEGGRFWVYAIPRQDQQGKQFKLPDEITAVWAQQVYE